MQQKLTSKPLKCGSHIFINKSSLKDLVKHPTYDMNAVTSKMSPGKVVPCCINLKKIDQIISKVFFNTLNIELKFVNIFVLANDSLFNLRVVCSLQV